MFKALENLKGYAVEFTIDDRDYVPIPRVQRDDGLQVTAVGTCLDQTTKKERPFMSICAAFPDPKTGNRIFCGNPNFRLLTKGPRKNMFVKQEYAKPAEEPQMPGEFLWLDEMDAEDSRLRLAYSIAKGARHIHEVKDRLWWPEIYAQVGKGFPTGLGREHCARLKHVRTPDLKKSNRQAWFSALKDVQRVLGYGASLQLEMVKKFWHMLRRTGKEQGKLLVNLKFAKVPKGSRLLAATPEIPVFQLIRQRHPADYRALRGKAGVVQYHLL